MNGAPNIHFTYELANASFWGSTLIFKGDQVITLTLDANGAPTGDIKTK